jgi:putative ABC transport system permease protein
MLGLAARNLTARKRRALSTALAVFFGVAMIAGTLMLSESVNRSFDDLFGEVNEGIDVTVRPQIEVEGEFGEAPTRALDASLLDRVRTAPGVEHAEGVIANDSITILDDEGERIGPPAGGPPHLALSVLDDPSGELESLVTVSGRAPRAPNEVSIDRASAEDEGFEIGDRVRITGTPGARKYTVTGIVEFGGEASFGGASIAQFTLPEAQRLTGRQGEFDEIDVEAAEGTSPEELARAIASELPQNVAVRTGEETAEEDASSIQEGFSFLTTSLLVFAGIAVFVGAFLIFNTFSITVAQRVREFAMLRTLGASSRQVFASVLIEAALVGLLASALGIAGGFGFVELIKGLFTALGFDLPTSGLRIEPGTVAIAVGVGVGITVASALAPALRATRVAPLEALRESAGAQVSDRRRRGRRRAVAATLLIALGVAAVLVGLFGSDGFGRALSMLGAGLVLLFVGIAMFGDRFVPPLASALGWPIERLRGVTGRLARENSQRQPGRTATTAAALMIGVALVVFVGVFASSLRASIGDTLDRQFAGDVAVRNVDGFSPITAEIAAELRGIQGVRSVSPVVEVPAEIDEADGDRVLLRGLDPGSITSVTDFDWDQGSDETIAELAPDEAIVESGWAEDNGVDVGDEITVTGSGGDRITATVAGTVRDPSGLFVDSVALPRETVRRRLGARDDSIVFASFASGANPDASRGRIDRLLETRFPNAEARSQQELRDDWEGEIDQLLALIYAMLGLSVIVSIFGIVNTLSLTIFERTREIGMLRAIGTSRSQVRRLVRYESVVTALLGASTGAVIGLLLAIGAVEALREEGLILSISVGLLIAVMVAAIVIGVIAAIRPARRASRLNVIESLQYE